MGKELPNGWVLTSIKEINFRKSKNINPMDSPESTFELYSVPNFQFNEPEFLIGEEIKSTKQVVSEDEVLVCKINPRINRVWIVSNHSEHQKIASSEWIIVDTKSLISAHYLKYLFSAPFFRTLLQSEVSGVGGSLTRARPILVNDYPIPLAPLQEQKRIVAKLDELFGHLDVLKAKLDRIPELLKNFRQQVLTQAVTGKLTEDVMQPVDLGSYLQDIKYGTSKKSMYDIEGFPILRIPNIKIEDGTIDVSDLKYSDLDEKEYEKLRLQKDDVLIIRSNGSVTLVGQSAIIKEKEVDFAYAGYLVRLRVGTGLNPEYLNYALRSNFMRKQIVETARSTSGVNNINTKEMKELVIPISSITAQNKIVGRIKELFKVADNFESQYHSLKQKIDRLPQAILNKAFKGELVPQDPKDEPASELLKRIQKEKGGKTK